MTPCVEKSGRLYFGRLLRVFLLRASLLRASSERQQGDVACLLDRSRQAALVRGTNPGQASRSDLAAFRHELRQQTHIFIVDRFDLLDAECTHFLATEKPAFTINARPPEARAHIE